MGHSLVAHFEANVSRWRGQRLYTWLSTACEEKEACTYGEMAARGRAVCYALRRSWSVPGGARVMLIYPPGLDFIIAFFGCQYAAIVAVPYYPPIIPTSPMPSAGERQMLADGLARVARIYASCQPEMLLSTTQCTASPAACGPRNCSCEFGVAVTGCGCGLLRRAPCEHATCTARRLRTRVRAVPLRAAPHSAACHAAPR